LLGLLSLFWFIFRTGAKPSRITYPCQKAAATSGSLWLTVYVLPLVSALGFSNHIDLRKRNLLFASTVMVIVTIAAISLINSSADLPVSSSGQPMKLGFAEVKSKNPQASTIFVINGTTGNDDGVKKLIGLMDANGMPFYQSSEGTPGLIARDDNVILKVNSQWDERGGTNTDLVKSLVEAIVNHPEGFTGEVIIADNGQARGSLSYARNNAQDVTQSMQNVAESFPRHNVSTYLWDEITSKKVKEYSKGDMSDGYILADSPDKETGIVVSYPKFKTERGTYISFKLGIWDPVNKTYNSEKLKVINIPVLKSHSGYGVTASTKHYMGVVSNKLTGEAGGQAHHAIGDGGMGTQLVETRFPALNILDAIWINANPRSGPATSYDEATNTNVIAASTNPVALDYWAAKNILVPVALSEGHSDISSMDPDYCEPGSFGNWLGLSKLEIKAAGYAANADDEMINIYIVNNGN